MKRPIMWRLASLLMVTSVRLHLRLAGFRRTWVRAHRMARWTKRHDREAPVAFACEVARTLEGCAAIFPGRAQCLEQSVSLFLLLRWARVPAELQLGVVVLPFAAHCWVEVDGVPVNTESDLLDSLQRLPSLSV